MVVWRNTDFDETYEATISYGWLQAIYSAQTYNVFNVNDHAASQFAVKRRSGMNNGQDDKSPTNAK